MEQNNGLVLYCEDYLVLGALIYDRKKFNYMQLIQGSTMDMFNLSIDEVNWYMKRWVLNNFNEEVFDTDGVYWYQ